MSRAKDLTASIVEQLIAQIEAGADSWTMPWNNWCVHRNAISRRPYRGVNIFMLTLASKSTAEWATYKQWSSIGAQVRKGEKSTEVILWKPVEKQTDDDEVSRGLIARTFRVFNADQVDGYEPTGVSQVNEDLRLEWLDDAFATIPAVVTHGPGGAFYRPSTDTVHMPPLAAFHHIDGYYRTLAHELVHWTGHESRLARDLGNRFGSDAYAMEELIAELGAALVGAEWDIPGVERTDHAAYLASWIRCLRADPTVLWTVSSRAQAAADHLFSYQLAPLDKEMQLA